MPQINQHEIDAKIDAILNRWPAVGLAVGVIRDGALGFSGHGVANAESAMPVTEDTVFRIGSITKTFTAVAVMQLWSGPDRAGCSRQRLPARVPAHPSEGKLAAGDDAAAANAHRRRAGVAAPIPHDQQRLGRGRTFASRTSECEPRGVLPGGVRLAGEPGTIWTSPTTGSPPRPDGRRRERAAAGPLLSRAHCGPSG